MYYKKSGKYRSLSHKEFSKNFRALYNIYIYIYIIISFRVKNVLMLWRR